MNTKTLARITSPVGMPDPELCQLGWSRAGRKPKNVDIWTINDAYSLRNMCCMDVPEGKDYVIVWVGTSPREYKKPDMLEVTRDTLGRIRKTYPNFQPSPACQAVEQGIPFNGEPRYNGDPEADDPALEARG